MKCEVRCDLPKRFLRGFGGVRPRSEYTPAQTENGESFRLPSCLVRKPITFQKRKSVPVLPILLIALVLNNGSGVTFSLKNLDDRWVSYRDIKGKVTLIDFWATWCAPCLKSLPKIEDLHRRYTSRSVSVVGVSLDTERNQPKVGPFVHSRGISYPILLDPQSRVAGSFGVTTIPTIIILDSTDATVYVHRGWSAGDETIIEREILKCLTTP
jgi:thiol-disulfide isomerase/thioredoxin